MRKLVVSGLTAGLLLTTGPLTAQAEPGGQVAPQWVATYDDGDGTDTAEQVVVDPASGISVVTGTVEPAGGGAETVTVAYAPDGQPLWTRRVAGDPGSYGQTGGLSLDAARGRVYVSGQRVVDGNTDIFTVAYDLAGTELWLSGYDEGRTERVAANTVDPVTGVVYLAGGSRGTSTLDSDFLTQAINPDGSLRWVTRTSAPGRQRDTALALVVGPDGGVYVTGESSIGDGVDSTTVAYSPTGELRWTRRLGSLGSNRDSTGEIGISADGRAVFVAGSSDDRALVAALSTATGRPLWVREPALGGRASYTALVLGPEGQVYVAGVSAQAGSSSDVIAAEYSALGATVWTTTVADPADREDGVEDMAFDPTRDRLYVADRRIKDSVRDLPVLTVLALDAGSGALDGSFRYGTGPGVAAVGAALALDGAAGRIVVTGSIQTPTRPEADYLTVSFPL